MLQPFKFLEGRRHERAGRWAEAQVAYEKALTGAFAGVARWQYRLGFVHYKQKHWPAAENALRAAIAASAGHAQWHVRLGLTLEQLHQFDAAIAAFDAALAKGSSAASVQLRRAACFAGQQRWQEAEEAIRAATECSNVTANDHNTIAEFQKKRGRTWQEVEALERAVERDASHADWFARLGAAREAMGAAKAAAAAYRKAIALEATEAQWHFRLGRVLGRAGRSAEVAFRAAIKHDAKLKAGRFGMGVFYQHTGEWEEAAKAYAAALPSNPIDAELHYRLGLSHDRCFQWQAATLAYSAAVALKPKSPSWHARLGFVLERQGNWEAASAAYGVAVRQDPGRSDWSYRLGFVLHRAGLHERACAAFLSMEATPRLAPDDLLSPVAGQEESHETEASPVAPEARLVRYAENLAARRRELLERDVSSATAHYLLGCDHEQAENWTAAAAEYRAAALRADTHQPEHYYRLGAALAHEGEYSEACEAFVQTRLLRLASGLPEASLNESVSVRRSVTYAERYEELPLIDDVVLYESFLGASMSGNPLAVFKELRGREECKGWTHVWAVNQLEKVPREFRDLPDVWFVTRGSDAYRRHLASARLLVNNVSFPEYFLRKPGQLYLNTWHGTPIKHLGKDVREELLMHKNVARNFLHATHILSPNPHTTRILLERYDVAGIVPGVVAQTGYPRIDATLNATPQSKQNLRERLGIRGSKQRIALYAPTWRGTHDGDIQVDLERLEADVRQLRARNYTLLFRGHHMAEERLAESPLSACTVPPDIDTNELLSIVDVLITDYSSIAFDFLVTGRPIIYYAYDLEEYERARGLYFPLSDMPGEICTTIIAVAEALQRALTGVLLPSEEAYRQARQKYCPAEDGKASRRVVDLILHDKTDGLEIRPSDRRKSLLFYVGPLLPNGILASWKNLVSALDPKQYVVTLVLEPASVSGNPERVREFEALPPHVQVLGRGDLMNSTLEERWVMGKFHAHNRLASDEMMECYLRMFAREYRRVFGDARFDCVVNFEGYNRFWVAILAGSGRGRPRRAIVLHNDMLNEWRMRFPYLEGIFRLYGRYDVIASVSRLSRDLNRTNLTKQFGLDPDRFDFCENLQNPERILELAQMPIESAEHRSLLGTSGPKFLTVGRLSPEKDQAKLIRAFATLHREHPSARLFIMGDGPLRGTIRKLIGATGLRKRVFLLGHQTNPFPYLARSDCFVLSSNHEGQPMVLFEAMILKKPIIATNITGSRGVLDGRAGLLVENSESGLLDGMRRFIMGEVQPTAFDHQDYQESALAQFVTTIVGEIPN